MKMKHVLPAMLAGTFLLTSCGAETTEATVAEVYTAVESYQVAPSYINKTMVYAGQIAAAESVNVVGKVSGKVEAVYFDVGDTVEAGDALFKLDEKDIQNQINSINAQIRQSQTSINTARNALDTVTGGSFQSGILQMESSIEALEKNMEATEIALANAELTVANAKNALDLVETSFESTKALFEIDAVSQIAYDQAELEYNNAVSAYNQALNGYENTKISLDQLVLQKNQAEETLELTKGQITDENMRSAQLGVSTAEAARSTLQVQLQNTLETLADTTVTSPIRGTVSVKNVKENEFTSTALPAFVIVDIDKVNVEVKVSELLINTVYPGQEVEVYIQSLQAEPFIGTVKTVSPAADQTSTFPVSIEISNADGLIKPGMFAEVHFVKEESNNTVVVPRNAVLEDDSNKYVYLIENNEAKKVIVSVGIDNGSEIEILDGVQTGDKVIVKGQTYVSNGEKINDVTAGEE